MSPDIKGAVAFLVCLSPFQGVYSEPLASVSAIFQCLRFTFRCCSLTLIRTLMNPVSEDAVTDTPRGASLGIVISLIQYEVGRFLVKFRRKGMSFFSH